MVPPLPSQGQRESSLFIPNAIPASHIDMLPITPQWPALIQHQGDAELEYIPHAEAFDTWQRYPISTPAIMIDAAGLAFDLGNGNHLQPRSIVSLEEILSLIRAHAALEGICCTTKLGASDIPSAMALLASLVQE